MTRCEWIRRPATSSAQEFPPVMPEPGVIIDEGSVEASVAKLMQLIKD